MNTIWIDESFCDSLRAPRIETEKTCSKIFFRWQKVLRYSFMTNIKSVVKIHGIGYVSLKLIVFIDFSALFLRVHWRQRQRKAKELSKYLSLQWQYHTTTAWYRKYLYFVCSKDTVLYVTFKRICMDLQRHAHSSLLLSYIFIIVLWWSSCTFFYCQSDDSPSQTNRLYGCN